MTKRTHAASAMLTALAVSTCFFVAGVGAALAAKPQAAAKLTPEDAIGSAKFSWWLFAQAVRPSGNAQRPLIFETWKEQCEIQPALCASNDAASASQKSSAKASAKAVVRRGHGSVLSRLLAGDKRSDSSVGCKPMNIKGFSDVPATNVAPGAVFCEEVFTNAAETNFILNNKLTTIAGQQAFGNINFPRDAVEIKVNWAPQSSFVKSFECNDPTLYIETIQFEGEKPQCYALVGLHLSSKILPDWLWATFEPNNALTNPNRCNDKLYGKCFDPWGTTSGTPYGIAETPKPSKLLEELMTALKLPAAFRNYYLTGTQTQFVQNGKATELGGSFIEFNAGVQPHQGSCITCHKYAYAGTTTIGHALPGWPNIGYACNTPNPTANCLPPKGTKGWTTEDFSWLLGIMK